jgi:menaquinone-dependent protoporphyrinogen oxidase
MENKVLITYASKAGSTANVAERIARKLEEKNLNVDLQPVNEVSGIESYSTVVLGSAIRAGSLLPEAKSFLYKQQAQLQQKHFSVFVVCLTLQNDTEDNRKTVSAYLDPVRSQIKPNKEGLFAGVMNASRLGFLARMMMKAMKAPDGDYRSWEAIDAWAEELSREITTAAQPLQG